jgi:hypothetical protein
MADYTFIAGTRWPSIYGTAEAPAGTPVDISGKTVRFVMTLVAAATPTLEVTGTVVNGPLGQMRYDWAVAQPPAAGHYLCQWEVDVSAGITGVFPSDGPLTIDIVQDLGAPTATPRGYTSPSQVAGAVGADFTSAQNARCLELIAEAEDWIDNYAGRTYKASTAITDERYPLAGTELYLQRAPVTSITTVKVRPAYVGATLTTLVADTDYALIDATRGLLRLAYLYNDPSEVLVTYVPAVTVPGRITRACTLLVASWMASSTSGLPSGVKRYSVGGELTVEFADGSVGTVPQEVKDLIGPRRVAFV